MRTAVARRVVGWPRASRGSQDDSGEPYEFMDAAQLIDVFFDEVERYMAQRGLGTSVVKVEEKRKPK